MLPSSPFPVVIFLWQFLIVGFSFVASIAIVVVVGVRLDGGYSRCCCVLDILVSDISLGSRKGPKNNGNRISLFYARLEVRQ